MSRKSIFSEILALLDAVILGASESGNRLDNLLLLQNPSWSFSKIRSVFCHHLPVLQVTPELRDRIVRIVHLNLTAAFFIGMPLLSQHLARAKSLGVECCKIINFMAHATYDS